MARHYRTYSNDQLCDAVAKVHSMSGLLRELGLVCAGGNYDHMRCVIQKLNVDTSHWTGQAWNKGKQLKDWSSYKCGMRRKLWLISLRGHKCEACQLCEWLGDPIPLEVHHIDGDRTNNVESNLQLLCPNCHARTPNFRGKACQLEIVINKCLDCFKPISAKAVRCNKCARHARVSTCEINHCTDCSKPIDRKAQRCKRCAGIQQDRPTKIAWPSNDELKQMLADSSYLAVGRKLGVSDNAVRKRLYASTEISAGLITKAV